MKILNRIERKLSIYVKNNIENNFNNVEWLSYHIPKTAGTSFRNTLCEAFGDEAVYGVYASTNAKEFIRGESVWIPRGTELLHGHFNPHRRHEILFPNGKRIIWLRDPIRRAWSLLNHTLDIKSNQVLHSYIKQNFLDKGILSREEIFVSMLADSQSKEYFTKYHISLKDFPKTFFHFVGKTEDYDEGIKKLSELMDKDLQSRHLNTSKNNNPAPNIPLKLLGYFDNEYTIYDRLTSR